MNTDSEKKKECSAGVKLVLFLARVAMGASMIGLGLRLFIGGGWDAWNSVGVVLPSTYPRGPIGQIFLNFWGNYFVIQLLIWSAVLIGLALVFGVAVRLASYGGMLIMLMMYLAVIPPSSVIVNQQLMYILVLGFLAVGEAGKVAGFDKFLAPPLEDKYPMLKYLLG